MKKKSKHANEHTLKPGDKIAEKWTEETVLPIIEAIWATLCKGKEDVENNIVRANDIKLLGEVCLMHDVTKQRWNEWEKKFERNEPITDFIKKIRWVLECRLNYSGQTMDIFILKNHYDYRDKSEVSNTHRLLGLDAKEEYVD